MSERPSFRDLSRFAKKVSFPSNIAEYIPLAQDVEELTTETGSLESLLLSPNSENVNLYADQYRRTAAAAGPSPQGSVSLQSLPERDQGGARPKEYRSQQLTPSEIKLKRLQKEMQEMLGFVNALQIDLDFFSEKLDKIKTELSVVDNNFFQFWHRFAAIKTRIENIETIFDE